MANNYSSDRAASHHRSEINVTPYIDILLVLLIIFMVITPMAPSGIEVKLPLELKAPVKPGQDRGIVLSLHEDGSWWLQSRKIEYSKLPNALENIFASRADRLLFIQAAPGMVYGDVVRAIDIAKGAGASEIGLLLKQIGPAV